MKQQVVFHIQKGKGSGNSLENHNVRSVNHTYSFQSADPNQSHLNETIIHHHQDKLSLAIKKRISEGYTGTTAIRKDAVKYISIVMSGSHNRMKEIEDNPKLRADWINENRKYIEDTYGKDNVMHMSIHRDEKTMHAHAIVVPITKEGRLSAKDVMGDRKHMVFRQTDYAEKVGDKFGLERGTRNSKAKHEDPKVYQRRKDKEVQSASEEVSHFKNMLNPKKAFKQGFEDGYQARANEENRHLGTLGDKLADLKAVNQSLTNEVFLTNGKVAELEESLRTAKNKIKSEVKKEKLSVQKSYNDFLKRQGKMVVNDGEGRATLVDYEEKRIKKKGYSK